MKYAFAGKDSQGMTNVTNVIHLSERIVKEIPKEKENNIYFLDEYKTDLSKLSIRIDELTKKSNKAGTWDSIKKGFDILQKSSYVASIGSFIAAVATVNHAHDVNNIAFDPSLPLTITTAVAAASLVGIALSGFGGDYAFRKSGFISQDIVKERDKIQELMENDLKLRSIKSIDSNIHGDNSSFDALYTQVFSKNLETPREKERNRREHKNNN